MMCRIAFGQGRSERRKDVVLGRGGEARQARTVCAAPRGRQAACVPGEPSRWDGRGALHACRWRLAWREEPAKAAVPCSVARASLLASSPGPNHATYTCATKPPLPNNDSNSAHAYESHARAHTPAFPGMHRRQQEGRHRSASGEDGGAGDAAGAVRAAGRRRRERQPRPGV